MLTVVLASDIQYGAPYLPAVGDALIRAAHEAEPDLVVVPGDLTQRARVREFRGVMELLARLPDVPRVLTPGNHDVPLYRVWERLFVPYRNWRRFVGRDLDTVTRIDGATVVALNSSAPRRAIVNGRLDRAQVEFARATFASCASDELKLVVTHHHFLPTPERDGGRPLPGSAALLRAFEDMGVDAVLGGHIHQSVVHLSGEATGSRGEDPGVLIVRPGTVASRRGRGAERGRNTFHVLRFGAQEVQVVRHAYVRESHRFEVEDSRTYPARHPRTTARAPGRDR